MRWRGWGSRFGSFPRFHSLPHAVDFYLQQVNADPCAVNRLRCAAEDFAVIHPFASNPLKRWPLEKFQAVARKLEMPVQWCAGPEEELADAVRIANL